MHTELHTLYFSANIITIIKSRRMRLARYIARILEVRKAHKIPVEKTEGNRPLGINKSIILKFILWKQLVSVDWINLAMDRKRWRGYINTSMNFQVPKKHGM